MNYKQNKHWVIEIEKKAKKILVSPGEKGEEKLKLLNRWCHAYEEQT